MDRMKQLKKTPARDPWRELPETREIGPLRRAFARCADLLKHRRADLLQPATIAAYVELDWLAWNGGGLKLTTVGENICAQVRNEAAARLAS